MQSSPRDPSDWNDDELFAFLLNYGIEDVEFDRAVMISLVTSLITIPSPTVNPDVELERTSARRAAAPSLGQPVRSRSVSPVLSPEISTAPASITAKHTNQHHEDCIKNFVDFTGSTRKIAEEYLVVNSWNTQNAINQFVEGKEPVDERDRYEQMGHSRRDRSGSGPDVFDEYGIRQADPRVLSRLLSSSNEDDDPTNKMDEEGVDWVFGPPTHLSFPGSLESAKELAKADKKWLLVNIQNHLEFASSQLNRDTWTDDTVISIVRCSFVFWQRGNTSLDGKNFMRLHRLSDHNLPIVCVIDPRTGAMLKNWNGFLQPTYFSELLVEFLDNFSMDTVHTATKSKSRAESIDETSTNSNEKIVAETVFHKAESKAEIQSKPGTKDSVKVDSSHGATETLAVAKDYGPIPCEPNEKDANAVRISIKLINGKQVVRRYAKDAKVKGLYAVCHHAITCDSSIGDKSFDLIMTYPPKNLSSSLESTLDNEGLASTQVMMKLT